jgi:hypothetical protein
VVVRHIFVGRDRVDDLDVIPNESNMILAVVTFGVLCITNVGKKKRKRAEIH